MTYYVLRKELVNKTYLEIASAGFGKRLKYLLTGTFVNDTCHRSCVVSGTERLVGVLTHTSFVCCGKSLTSLMI